MPLHWLFSLQILNDKPDDRRKDLTFIPLAPACVVSAYPNVHALVVSCYILQTTYTKKCIVSLGNPCIDSSICYPPSCWPVYLENILDFTLVSSHLFYARIIQDTRGIDTALPCELVCKFTAHKKATCGLKNGTTILVLTRKQHVDWKMAPQYWCDGYSSEKVISLWCLEYSKHCSCYEYDRSLVSNSIAQMNITCSNRFVYSRNYL
jgi:hypothetical protein